MLKIGHLKRGNSRCGKENIYSRPVRSTLHLSLLCCLPRPFPRQPLSHVFHFIVVCLPIPVLTVSRKLRVLTPTGPRPLCAWPSICYAHFWLSLRCFCEVDTAFQQVKGPRAVQRMAAALNASSRMQLKDIHKRYISCSVGWRTFHVSRGYLQPNRVPPS